MNDMYDFAITLTIICMDFKALSTRMTLNTLSVLNNLSVLNPYKLMFPDCTALYIISKIERRTTEPSNQFIRSNKYFYIPIAIIFEAISTIKMLVNH